MAINLLEELRCQYNAIFTEYQSAANQAEFKAVYDKAIKLQIQLGKVSVGGKVANDTLWQLRNLTEELKVNAQTLSEDANKIALYAFARSFSQYPLLERFQIPTHEFINPQWSTFPEVEWHKRLSTRMQTLHQFSQLIAAYPNDRQRELVQIYRKTFTLEKVKEALGQATQQPAPAMQAAAKQEKTYEIRCVFSGNMAQLTALREAVEKNKIKFEVIK